MLKNSIHDELITSCQSGLHCCPNVGCTVVDGALGCAAVDGALGYVVVEGALDCVVVDGVYAVLL